MSGPNGWNKGWTGTRNAGVHERQQIKCQLEDGMGIVFCAWHGSEVSRKNAKGASRLQLNNKQMLFFPLNLF